MKHFLSALALLALLTVSAWAQEAAETVRLKAVADAKMQIEMAQAVGGTISFEAKVVKGAPYSATSESETIQMLTDGNRIRNKTTTTVYRDSEGRTRKEMAGKTPDFPAQVFINDPVSGTNYSLNPQQRVAMKQPGGQIRLTSGTVNGGIITIRGEEVKPEQLGEAKRAIDDEQKMRRAKLEAEKAYEQLDEAKRAIYEKGMRAGQEAKQQEELKQQLRTTMQPAVGAAVLRKKTGTQESLGQQMIEGVLCEGKRTTVTIPANTIGNDLPINVVSEEWYSPELQVLVLTKHNDPRNGETIYRLTNINRSEPAHALFEVPADYTVQESFKPVMTRRAKEEQ